MTVSTGTTFAPPSQPTVSGRNITVDAYLNNPLRVAADVQALTSAYFISDRIYSPGGTATGGAVLYDQVASGFFFTKRDVQQINPGQEFPLLDMEEETPLVARVNKFGGAMQMTYEDIRRNRTDKLAQGLTRLRNTVTRKVDAVAIAVLRAAPIVSQLASASWSDPSTAIVKDVLTGLTAVDKLDLGYKITAALISPNTELNMMTNDKLNDLIGKANGQVQSPLVSRQLSNVLGINWIPTSRVADDEVLLLAERSAGSISDEVPLYTRVVDDPKQERKLIMAGRLTVPYVTNPKAVIRISGIA